MGILFLIATYTSIFLSGSLYNVEDGCIGLPLFRSSLTCILIVIYYTLMTLTSSMLQFFMSSVPSKRFVFKGSISDGLVTTYTHISHGDHANRDFILSTRAENHPMEKGMHCNGLDGSGGDDSQSNKMDSIDVSNATNVVVFSRPTPDENQGAHPKNALQDGGIDRSIDGWDEIDHEAGPKVGWYKIACDREVSSSNRYPRGMGDQSGQPSGVYWEDRWMCAYGTGVGAFCTVLSVQSVGIHTGSIMSMSLIGISIQEMFSMDNPTLLTRIFSPLVIILYMASIAAMLIEIQAERGGNGILSPTIDCVVGILVPLVGAFCTKYCYLKESEGSKGVRDSMRLGAPVFLGCSIMSLFASSGIAWDCVSRSYLDAGRGFVYTYPLVATIVSPILCVCCIGSIVSSCAADRTLDTVGAMISLSIFRGYMQGHVSVEEIEEIDNKEDYLYKSPVVSIALWLVGTLLLLFIRSGCNKR